MGNPNYTPERTAGRFLTVIESYERDLGKLAFSRALLVAMRIKEHCPDVTLSVICDALNVEFDERLTAREIGSRIPVAQRRVKTQMVSEFIRASANGTLEDTG